MFSQPPVSPLPENLEFNGKVAVVTGATAGLGLEFSRQLLQRGISLLVLAVRNTAKGEAVRDRLLSEPMIQQTNPKAIIEIVKLDTASYQSVKDFATTLKSKCSRLDILMLNAGIFQSKSLTVDGHETVVQVNYLSNVLLLFELLPLLETTSSITGQPSRVSFTGSRKHQESTLRHFELPKGQSLLGYLDNPKSFHTLKRYGDSKFLLYLFLEELGKHYGPDKVIINQFCPGLVESDMSKALPFLLRVFATVYKKFLARPVQVGGWSGLHAVAVAGAESHSHYLHDKDLAKPSYVTIPLFKNPR